MREKGRAVDGRPGEGVGMTVSDLACSRPHAQIQAVLAVTVSSSPSSTFHVLEEEGEGEDGGLRYYQWMPAWRAWSFRHPVRL